MVLRVLVEQMQVLLLLTAVPEDQLFNQVDLEAEPVVLDLL